eukprot:3720806-Lingulodinium_polyedra.AAC.1
MSGRTWGTARGAGDRGRAASVLVDAACRAPGRVLQVVERDIAVRARGACAEWPPARILRW